MIQHQLKQLETANNLIGRLIYENKYLKEEMELLMSQ